MKSSVAFMAATLAIVVSGVAVLPPKDAVVFRGADFPAVTVSAEPAAAENPLAAATAAPEAPANFTDVKARAIIDGDGTRALSKLYSRSNFHTSCDSFWLRPSNKAILEGNCRTRGGGVRFSTLNLNSCYTNNCGQMQFAINGNYGGSCDVPNSALAGTVYHIGCPSCGGGSVWIPNQAQLSNSISNNDGFLVCP